MSDPWLLFASPRTFLVVGETDEKRILQTNLLYFGEAAIAFRGVDSVLSR